jgi:hypothetical protein
MQNSNTEDEITTFIPNGTKPNLCVHLQKGSLDFFRCPSPLEKVAAGRMRFGTGEPAVLKL